MNHTFQFKMLIPLLRIVTFLKFCIKTMYAQNLPLIKVLPHTERTPNTNHVFPHFPHLFAKALESSIYYIAAIGITLMLLLANLVITK